MSTAADHLRFARKIERLCALGARPVFELLREFAAERLLRQPLEAKVDDYLARLDRQRLALTGGARCRHRRCTWRGCDEAPAARHEKPPAPGEKPAAQNLRSRAREHKGETMSLTTQSRNINILIHSL